MPNLTVPDSRLCSAIPFLRRGGRIADVGTDHAYLPIHLIRQGIVREAIASDVNRGPLERAAENIRAAGLEDRIRLLLTDGLHGVEDFCPDDVLIFGMGGELIVRILSEAEWIRDGSVGLILQPMTRVHILRAWLNENGFSIRGEALTKEEKIYQTIYAVFDGGEVPYSEEELLLGRRNIETDPPLFAEFVRHEITVREKILRGKERSDTADAGEDLRILTLLKKRLEKLT